MVDCDQGTRARPRHDRDVVTFVTWFAVGIATSLAGGIVFGLVHSLPLAFLTGLVVLGVLRLANAGAGG